MHQQNQGGLSPSAEEAHETKPRPTGKLDRFRDPANLAVMARSPYGKTAAELGLVRRWDEWSTRAHFQQGANRRQRATGLSPRQAKRAAKAARRAEREDLRVRTAEALAERAEVTL